MNTRKLLPITYFALLTTIYLPVGKLSVQAQEGNRFSTAIQMVIDGDTDETRQRTSQSGIMDPIGLFRNEQIGVNLIFPGNRINYTVGIAPLDGGEIFGSENLAVDDNRTVHFRFRGGGTPGLYRVLLTVASEQYELQFYVSQSEPDSTNCPPPP